MSPSDPAFTDSKKTWPKVLAFDTSGPFLSVSWATESYSGADRTEMARGQAEALFPRLDAELRACGWAWKDVDALGVGIGPGNFTGIRISIAAARGLGLALGIPVFGLDAFRIAYGHHSPPAGTLVSVPGPRDMAYVQGYGAGAAPLFGPGLLIDPQDPPPHLQLSSGMEVFGHRAHDIASHFEAARSDETDPPCILNLAELAEVLYQDATSFPPPPAPLYIKPPGAAPSRDAPPLILP